MATLKVPVTSADHSQGPEGAETILVEYGDYECPHCGHAYPIVKQVQKHFGKRLRFIFRNCAAPNIPRVVGFRSTWAETKSLSASSSSSSTRRAPNSRSASGRRRA